MTNTCLDCGVKISRRAKRCQSCASKAMRAQGVFGEEYRRKLSKAMKAAWARGDLGNTEHRRKLSKACQDPEHRHKQSEATKAAWARGDLGNTEHRRNQSRACQDPEHRRKQSEATKAAWARGDLGNTEYRRKISEAMKALWQNPEHRAKHTGENSNLWRDGTAHLYPYPPEFSETLRQAIRERDGFICVLCGKPQDGKALDVHHIDRNKENNGVDNLVALCNSCHSKVHASGDFDAYRVGFQALFARGAILSPQGENDEH